jgi:hypothetical protein
MSRGGNLIVERYSGEGRPKGYADLAREVGNRNPDVIVALRLRMAGLAIGRAACCLQSSLDGVAERATGSEFGTGYGAT